VAGEFIVLIAQWSRDLHVIPRRRHTSARHRCTSSPSNYRKTMIYPYDMTVGNERSPLEFRGVDCRATAFVDSIRWTILEENSQMPDAPQASSRIIPIGQTLVALIH
jgi:hypothetical protein